jgi:hypothetical protein
VKAPSTPGKSGEAQHHVIICHRTGSAKNPYVVINVSVRAWLHGHQTLPALDGRVDLLLKDPAAPGEKLPASRCQNGTNSAVHPGTVQPGTVHPGTVQPGTGVAVTNGILVIDATARAGAALPSTTIVNEPLVIVVHTTPNATVTVAGAGVLGVTTTISNQRGVARIRVTPTKTGVLGVSVDRRVVKRVGVLGAQKTSGKKLTG